MVPQYPADAWAVGSRVRIWWPVQGGPRAPFDATIADCEITKGAKRRKKSRYRLKFDDGDMRWSKLDGTSRVETLPPAQANRPYYIGSTDPGQGRTWVCEALLGVPTQIDAYYMCVGGLSGFDAFAVLLANPVSRPMRLVIYDRDDGAISFGRLMVALVRQCASRSHLLHAIFGRCPAAWERLHQPLTARSMFDYLNTDIDGEHLASVRLALPAPLQPLYDTVVRAAAYALDYGDRQEAGMIGMPARRVWPCWELQRGCRPLASGLGGGGSETFHYGEAGWLSDDCSYELVRRALVGNTALPLAFAALDLNDMRLEAIQGDRSHCVYISNADQSTKFLPLGREGLERRLSQQVADASVLLVSTRALSRVYSAHVDLIACRLPVERTTSDGVSVAAEARLQAALKALRRRELCVCLELFGDELALDQRHLNFVLGALHE